MRRCAMLCLLALAGCGAQRRTSEAGAGTRSQVADDELRHRLTPLQYEVTQHEVTEPPFHNEFWDNHREGLYVDVVSGQPLFSSRDKFDSGTGWPSFTRPVADTAVVTRSDRRLGVERTEVRSRAGDAHLGHLFDDGPPPTRQRYCINSAALRFVPVDQLEAAGYGEWLPRFGRAVAVKMTTSAAPETAILAGGCFWGMEELLRKVPGVLDTEVGYTAGAESVRVVFDPKRLPYGRLLEDWYFRMHDPTTQDRQGNDVGRQYRSAIFATTPEQRLIAAEVKQRVERSGKWKRPVVTEITDAPAFEPAPAFHQDYLQRHPDGYTCHYLRD